MLDPMEYCGRKDDDVVWNRCEKNVTGNISGAEKSVCYFHSIECDKPNLPTLAPTEVGGTRAQGGGGGEGSRVCEACVIGRRRDGSTARRLGT